MKEEISLNRELKNVRAKKYATRNKVITDNKEYEAEFIKKFNRLTDEELINEFNSKVDIDYFNFYVQGFMNAMRKEFLKRNFDYSVLGNQNIISFKNKIRLKNKKIFLITENYNNMSLFGYFKNQNIGIKRLLIIGMLFGAGLIGFIFEPLTKEDTETGKYLFATFAFGVPIYWLVVFCILWIKQGFEIKKTTGNKV